MNCGWLISDRNSEVVPARWAPIMMKSGGDLSAVVALPALSAAWRPQRRTDSGAACLTALGITSELIRGIG
jgi:hypothetical protein